MGNDSRALWISVAAGLLAAFLLYSYSQEKVNAEKEKFGPPRMVVVAQRDIGELQTIDETMLEIKSLPTEFLQPGAVADQSTIVGQVAATAIKKGEQIISTKLLTPGPETGISIQVAPSKRAVTLPVDEIRAVAKLIRPGDRIDIYAIVDSGRGVTAKREAMIMMQDVVVLATGVQVVNTIPRTIEEDAQGRLLMTQLTGDTKYSSITVEATPKEAQDLIYIISTSPGNLFYTLRNPSDRTIPPRLPSTSAESVLGRANGELQSFAQPQQTTVLPSGFALPTPPSFSGSGGSNNNDSNNGSFVPRVPSAQAPRTLPAKRNN